MSDLFEPEDWRETGLMDRALLARIEALARDESLMVVEVCEIEGTSPVIALVDPEGLVKCYVALTSDEEGTVRALVDLWEEMKARPRLLH